MPRKIFPLKLSDDERAALERQAQRAGMDCTNYLRFLIAKDGAPVGEALAHLRERQGDWGKSAPLVTPEDIEIAGQDFDFGP